MLSASSFALSSGLSPNVCMFGGMLAGLGGIIGFNFTKAKQITEYKENVPYLKTINSPLRIGLYSLGMGGIGVSATPLFAMA